jgi:phosphoribosylformylglycinamidine synthase
LFEKRKILEWIEAQADGCCQLGIPLLGGVTDFEVQHGVSFWMAALAQKSSTHHPVLHPALQHRFGQKIILIGASHSGASGVTSGMEREDSQPQFASLMNDRLYGEWLAELKHLGCLIQASSAHAGVLPAVIKMIPEGAHLDLDPVFESSADISEYQFLMSLAPGRVVLTLEAEAIEKFQALAKRRGIPYSVLGEVREQGSIQVYRQGQLLYSHESSGQKKDQTQGDEAFREVFLPEMQSIRPKNLQPLGAFESRGAQTLFELLSYPNICSKESWIKKHDLDQQGFAVIRPLHFSQICGPNDGALLKLKFNSQTGLMVGVGSCSRFGELSHDQLLERAVDEALRNLYASGLGTGQQVYLQSSWSGVSLHDGDWIEGPFEALCESYGAVHLGSFQHHHSLAQQGTLVVRALAKTPSFALGMSADFKSVGDQIYLLGDVGATRDRWLGLKASTLSFVREIPSEAWNASSQDGSFQKIYSWMSGAIGSEQKSLHSVHDVSEGGLLVTVAESLLARGMGAQLQFPDWVLHQDLMKWNFAFGEGFHSFVVSVPHALAQSLENEWSTCEVPFYHLGRVTADPILEIQNQWAMDLKSIRLAWKREGMVL